MKIIIDAEERIVSTVAMGSTIDIRKDPLEIAFSKEGGWITIQLLGRTFEIAQNDLQTVTVALATS